MKLKTNQNGHKFEVIRLDCDLLLMDTVNVSSRVRTIAYRMYRPQDQNLKLDSKLNKLGFQNSDVAISNAKYLEHLLRTKSCLKILKNSFTVAHPVIWYAESSSRRK